MEQYGKGLKTSKKTERASQKKKKLNIVVGQRSLPELRMQETGVLVFQVGGSQFAGAR